ncbi:hypothetical protein BN2497_11599 [Janthinobacterium sp. CG23_2]|nr:hypothetical protein BN2497_11599 [Janthinobacterium sp. CG23_2]CUU32197.1 hypothetical protein BN3177_11599 [Janthinobacterium sp. CG23_2]
MRPSFPGRSSRLPRIQRVDGGARFAHTIHRSRIDMVLEFHSAPE